MKIVTGGNPRTRMPNFVATLTIGLVICAAVTAAILQGGPYEPEEVARRAEHALIAKTEILRRLELEHPQPCGPDITDECWNQLHFSPGDDRFTVEVKGQDFWIYSESADVPDVRAVATNDIPACSDK